MKVIRYLILLMLISSAVAACAGGNDDDDEPTEAPESTATTEATSAEQQPETTATDGEGTEPAADDTPGESAEPTAGGPTPTARVTPTPETSFENQFAFGWNVGLRGDTAVPEHNGRVAEMVNESGFGWVRFQMPWFAIEPEQDQWTPEPFDRMIDEMSAAGLNVLIVVAKAPDWAVSPDPEQFLNDVADFQDFMNYVSERYQGKVQAWEVWNEQNLAHEVGGYVNVEEYIEMLKAGSDGIRAGDPEALVVFGGLTPNGISDPTIAIDDFNYLNLAYGRSGGEISQYFDVLGVHANNTHNGPDENWPDNITSGNEGWNDHPSFFYRRAEQLRQVMVDNGDLDKPVWITEFGWTTANLAPGYEYGANNTEEEVAQFLTRSLEIATQEWDWCTGAFVWNLNWSTLVEESDEKYPWSALEGDWTPRPAFEAMREFPKQ